MNKNPQQIEWFFIEIFQLVLNWQTDCGVILFASQIRFFSVELIPQPCYQMINIKGGLRNGGRGRTQYTSMMYRGVGPVHLCINPRCRGPPGARALTNGSIIDEAWVCATGDVSPSPRDWWTGGDAPRALLLDADAADDEHWKR